MKAAWLERFVDSVADRGRELLARFFEEQAGRDIGSLCRALLSGRGEASGTAMSRELCRRYEHMDRDARLAFFNLLAREFSADPQAIGTAAERYLESQAAEDFVTLSRAIEPPRQELFRRMNMAPRGTATLVAMRAELLDLLPRQPQFRSIEFDLKHLFSSWFNRGFLRLEKIDWRSPAVVLEKLIQNDMVHEVRGWGDLRRRLAADRRCFAFFHPALPDEPLIFLEVALVRGMAAEAAPLLDQRAPVLDPQHADTAMFYSINNTQRGLRGLSFGNFLIKQVLSELSEEFPKLKVFATLSPMPGFASTIQAALRDEHPEFTRARLRALLSDYREVLSSAGGKEDPVDAIGNLLQRDVLNQRVILAEPLKRLSLAYLTLIRHDGDYFDPVASFHLANGARLEGINMFADTSSHRVRASYGVMVNYAYNPDEVVANHENFVGAGKIAMSRSLSRIYEKVATAWHQTAPGV